MLHLITGGAGFIGYRLSKELLRKGEKVRTVDIIEQPELAGEFDYTKVDVRNRRKINSALKDVNVVHHCAAQVPLNKTEKNFMDVNVQGSKVVAEEARNQNVDAFVYVSSSAIYGIPPECPVTPSDTPKPFEIYGKSKLKGESIIRDTLKGSPVKLYVIRPRTVLGEGRLGLFQLLFDWIRKDITIIIPGTGQNKIQFLHIKDLLDLYLHLLQIKKPGTYNVGTDSFGTMNNAIQSLIDYADSNSKVWNIPRKPTETFVSLMDKLKIIPFATYQYKTISKSFYFDIKPIKELGWEPTYSNQDMLQQNYDWYCEQVSSLSNGNESKSSVHRSQLDKGVLRFLEFLL